MNELQIKRFENSVFRSNSYVAWSSRNAIVIDIGDFRPILNFIDSGELIVDALLLTHTHYDHIYGILEFMDTFPSVPVYTSGFGKKALNNPKWNFSRYHEDIISIDSHRVMTLNDGEKLSFPGLPIIMVQATPGHDYSCLSYYIGDNIFTGDSFIPGIKVIASFPNSNKSLAALWYSKLTEQTDKYNIYPGHGAPLIISDKQIHIE